MQRRGVVELIRSLGVAHSVVLSTHLAEDVRSCADRLVILVEGRVALDSSFPIVTDGSAAARLLLVDLGLAGESAS